MSCLSNELNDKLEYGTLGQHYIHPPSCIHGGKRSTALVGPHQYSHDVSHICGRSSSLHLLYGSRMYKEKLPEGTLDRPPQQYGTSASQKQACQEVP